MDWCKCLIKSFVAGMLIGLGGTVFLSVDNKIVGSALFATGLLAICVTEQLLYTGQVSYIRNVPKLITILFGNLCGAAFLGLVLCDIKPNLAARATEMCQVKLQEETIIILGFFCNILIYFAVEGFKRGNNLLLVMCVMAFILCGFEHCVANMYYFAIGGAGLKIQDIAVYMVQNVLGNTLGGIAVQVLRSVESV